MKQSPITPVLSSSTRITYLPDLAHIRNRQILRWVRYNILLTLGPDTRFYPGRRSPGYSKFVRRGAGMTRYELLARLAGSAGPRRDNERAGVVRPANSLFA